jgi:hypothetical protein
MSYLTLSNGIPDFSKAVISLWFRVPKESVKAAAGHMIDQGNFPLMQSILPLVTFGRPQKLKIYDEYRHNVGIIHPYPINPNEPDPATTYVTSYYLAGPTYDVDPSYIGISCGGQGSSGERFWLEFHFQMEGYMAFSSTANITTQMDIWSGSDPAAPQDAAVPGSGTVALFPNVGQAKIQAADYLNNTQPEYFTVSTANSYKSDEWHHLLLSFDIGGSVSVGTPFASSTCRLWYAIDDMDYRGAENMTPYRDLAGQWGPDTLDPNAILTRNAWVYSGQDPNWEYPKYYQNHFIGLPQGSFSGGKIPSTGAAMGIPSSIKYQDGIFRVEMAEFQMWTGRTLDTGIKSNRRAFVSEHGEPVDPTGDKDDPRGPGERLLGKKPEILLHGSGDWEIGYNTGTLGIGADDKPLAAGQFKPTGGIKQFEPDPSLEQTTA